MQRQPRKDRVHCQKNQQREEVGMGRREEDGMKTHDGLFSFAGGASCNLLQMALSARGCVQWLSVTDRLHHITIDNISFK